MGRSDATVEAPMNGDIVKKVPASSVRYGEDVCERGGYVWVVYDSSGVLVGVYPTARAAKRAHSIWPQKTDEQRTNESERRYHPCGRGERKVKGCDPGGGSNL